MKLGIAAAATVAVVVAAFTQFDLISSSGLGPRLDKLFHNPRSMGPLQAHEIAIDKVSQDLSTVMLGVGPFQFANPISVGQVLGGSLGRKASSIVLAGTDQKGEEAKISLSSSLLAEFGVPAFLIVGLMYGAIGWRVWRATSRFAHRRTPAGGRCSCVSRHSWIDSIDELVRLI